MSTTATMTDQIIQGEKTYVVQSYGRPNFVLVHGEGVTVYDSEGNAYLDMVAGIAVNALGYGDSELNNIIQQQLSTGLIHLSNLYHTAPHVELAKLLVNNSFADRVFFCNSGTEANEGAMKFARKVAYKKQNHKTEVVCFTGAFHGRTVGALSVTPKEKYQKPFQPLMPDVVVAEYNDIESAKEAIGKKTVAVIVEPIQGEGGINIANPEFLQALRDFCDEYDAILIFDEIQCGVGRSGNLWGYEESGVTPDIMTVAKPLAAGLPIGAILVTEAVASAIEPGDHGTTFAGGPLVTSVAKMVMERVSQPQFLEQVESVGAYMRERLEEINSPHIVEIRGRGLMNAVEFDMPVASFVQQGYEQGLLLVNAGPNVLRFVPPLIMENHHIDTFIEKFTPILEAVDA